MGEIQQNPILRTWNSLNDALRGADEVTCQKLLEEELANKKRKRFIARIHSRLNKARADRERVELEVGK